jgi:hypothetical protein
VAKTLTDAIAQVQTLVGGLSGIKKAPQYPPDKISQFPFAVAFPGSGEGYREDASSTRELHNIRLEIHMARKNMARDIATVIGYWKLVFDELLSVDNLTLDGTVDTINRITYEFGPLGYADIDTIGYTFTIDVKIRS